MYARARGSPMEAPTVGFGDIYINRSCLQSITSVIGLTGIFTGQFLSTIKCVKERSANTVIILKA